MFTLKKYHLLQNIAIDYRAIESHFFLLYMPEFSSFMNYSSVVSRIITISSYDFLADIRHTFLTGAAGHTACDAKRHKLVLCRRIYAPSVCVIRDVHVAPEYVII